MQRTAELAHPGGLALVDAEGIAPSKEPAHLVIEQRAWFGQFLTVLRTCPGPVYVHCFGGDLRAGILLAHYRIHKQGWSYERALTEYQRLDANVYDSAVLVGILKENAYN